MVNQERHNIHKKPMPGVRCPRCGGRLYRSDIPSYSYQCFECDEDFYSCEVRDLYERTYTVSPTIEVKVTDIEIEDLLKLMFENNIYTDWAEKKPKSSEDVQAAAKLILSGGGIELADPMPEDAPEEYVLTVKRLLDGIRLFYEQSCYVLIRDNVNYPTDKSGGLRKP